MDDDAVPVSGHERHAVVSDRPRHYAQQQWLAVLEEQGHGSVLKSLPIPNSFPQGNEMQEFNYAFINTNPDPDEPSVGQNRRWTQGSSMDGRGEFKEIKAQPYGDEPQLAPPMPIGYAQAEQMAEAGNKQ